MVSIFVGTVNIKLTFNTWGRGFYGAILFQINLQGVGNNVVYCLAWLRDALFMKPKRLKVQYAVHVLLRSVRTNGAMKLVNKDLKSL